MANINFNTGVREFTINGDENKKIVFRPADFGILDRINKSVTEIEKLQKKYGEYKKSDNPSDTITTAAEYTESLDREIRKQINYIFDSDVCTPAFDNMNCLSLCGGFPMYQNFLNAILPEVEKEVNAEKKKSLKNIEKYTNQVNKK